MTYTLSILYTLDKKKIHPTSLLKNIFPFKLNTPKSKNLKLIVQLKNLRVDSTTKISSHLPIISPIIESDDFI